VGAPTWSLLDDFLLLMRSGLALRGQIQHVANIGGRHGGDPPHLVVDLLTCFDIMGKGEVVSREEMTVEERWRSMKSKSLVVND
jgi:hypothetical protein